ncbi:ribokinase [Streptomyces sp. NPDC056716]|uniref:ribokinase n=1 Tax=unclassified Streptomyces TaxID=2593676 RepID=UPI0036A35784
MTAPHSSPHSALGAVGAVGSILVVGTSNIDLTLSVAHLPASGETVLGDLSTACGGKAANQAVAAARLGARVDLVSRVGTDEYGRRLLRELNREGVGTERVRRIEDGTSGMALIMVDHEAQTVIGVAEGVNRYMRADDLDGIPQLLDPATVVVAELGVPLAVIRRLGELRARAGFTLILNPAPVSAPLPEDLWRAVDVLTPNATEAEVLTGLPITDDRSALAAAARLCELGARLAVVTLGARGVAYCGNQGSGVRPAFSVAPVDTTAASDAFNAGLAVALLSGRRDAEALVYGQAVAALSVTRRGAQPSMPSAAETAEFLASRTDVKEYA